ncbi:MAG TPA: hypothetical protein VJ140_05100 [Actinomycetota bacterium]|nr:hypothetical protein [Actinomycetota bacterium]
MKVLRIAAAWVVAVLSMAASVKGLWHVSFDLMKMEVLGSVAIVAAFDVTAIIAGMRVVEDPRKVTAWVLLCSMAAASATAQILAAPIELEWWRLGHGVPPLASIWTLHGAVGEHASAGKKKGKGTKPAKKTVTAQGSGSVAAPGSSPASAPPAPPVEERAGGAVRKVAPVASLADARRKGPHRPTETGVAPLSTADQKLVETAVERLTKLHRDATRREIETVLEVGNRVAGRLLPEVKRRMAEEQSAREADSGS